MPNMPFIWGRVHNGATDSIYLLTLALVRVVVVVLVVIVGPISCAHQVPFH